MWARVKASPASGDYWSAFTRRTVMRWVAAAGVIALGAAALVTLLGKDDHGRTCPGHAWLDLSGRTVHGSDLTQRPLRCVNLERSTVDGIVSEANLSDGNLHRVRLRQAWLEQVDLSGADLTGADARSATLTGVKLDRADLRRAALNDTTLTDVGMQRARLTATTLRGAVLTRSDLSGADARDADLTGASLVDSNLRGARLDGAKLARSTWSNVVCPDGAKSAGAQRESCDGHLRALR
jgi:uncharacterized protein YjbI with pentapeptide repeats